MPLSRWSRRHKRTFGKKKEESKVFLEEHRVPLDSLASTQTT